VRRRALLIGSRTGILAGVANDVRAMREALAGHGFETTDLQEREASYRGIRAAYRGLIEDTSAGDAAVVYFTGHGARYRNPGPGPAWLRYLVPTDRALVDGDEFNGVLAEELSLLQAELTARTANVTVILDCCYAARMSRGPTFLPKALTRSPSRGGAVIGARWRRLRAAAQGVEPAADSNPSAVRLVACGPEEVAYELPPEHGGPQGALTAAVTDVLLRPGSAELSWDELIALVRPAVGDLVPGQRPDVEGPATRRLFSLAEKRRTGVLPVLVDGRTAYLPNPGLLGVTAGDRYAVVAVGADPARPLATGTVTAVPGGRAPLRLDRDLPLSARRTRLEAHPVRVSLGRRPVAVVPPDHPERAGVQRALSGPVRLRPAEPGEWPLATIRLADGGPTLLDAGGEPLTAGRVTLPAVLTQLALTARASHLRELGSGTGEEALPDDVAVEFGLLREGGEEPLDLRGAHMFTGDEVVLRLHNRGAGRRCVSVFDIGLRGAVTLLTTSGPAGVPVTPGIPYELSKPVSNEVHGTRLFWPAGLPRGGPRPESWLAIVTDRPQDLRALTQQDIRTRGAGRSSLQTVIDDLVEGRRVRGGAPRDIVRYRVQRFDFLLHPRPRPLREPVFAIDERPDLSLRLSPPGPGGAPPRRLAVRLTGVRSPGRLHALVAARSPAGRLHRRWTTVEDGHGAELFDGAVAGAVELAVWSSPAAMRPAVRDHGPAPDDSLVDAMATLVRRISTTFPEAVPLLRATLPPHDEPRTITTDAFTLEMSVPAA
jgi:hypothetical protein